MTSPPRTTDEQPTSDTLVPCDFCDGGGKVTDDSFRFSWLKVREEMVEDPGGRTEDAIKSGALKFVDCPACDGQGRVPG